MSKSNIGTLIIVAAFGAAWASGAVSAQRPSADHTQWDIIPQSMHALVARGWVLTTVDGEPTSGGGQMTVFYLSNRGQLARCTEAYMPKALYPVTFPCEQLVEPHQ